MFKDIFLSLSSGQRDGAYRPDAASHTFFNLSRSNANSSSFLNHKLFHIFLSFFELPLVRLGFCDRV